MKNFTQISKSSRGILPLFALLCFVFLPVSSVSAGYKLAGGAYQIARNNIGTEGRKTSSGGLILNTTVGEVGIHPYSGGNIRFYPGYV